MPRLVFLHSTGLGPFMWKPYLGQVEGATEFAPCHRGYAAQDRIERFSPIGLKDDVEHALRQVPSDEPVHLVAHSWGATVALELARSGRLPVASMWLFEPVLFGSLLDVMDELDLPTQADVQQVVRGFRQAGAPEGGTEAWLEAFVDYWNGPGAWQAMGERARDSMRVVGWKMSQEVRGVFEDVRPFEDYGLDIPVTLVVGGRSPRPARAMVRQLAAVMPGATVQQLDHLGHMAVLHAAVDLLPLLRGHFEQLSLPLQGAPAAP